MGQDLAAQGRPPGAGDLEYLPYRKRFGTRVRHPHTHPYLAGHGYACVRLDIRGSGESEGVLRAAESRVRQAAGPLGGRSVVALAAGGGEGRARR